MNKPKRQRRQKFRFLVTGTFELEIDAVDRDSAAKRVVQAVSKIHGVGFAEAQAQPYHDWQVIDGGLASRKPA